MSQPIIEAQNISKNYTIAHRLPYHTLRDTVSNLFLKPFKVLRGRENDTKEEFWALRDINFSINQGERIGIIGRNGAGKSTLLKILSQITSPTTGQVTLRGRVASLLEVGTGFHPELSGRENVFLNGTILGMKQSEIRNKFNEIVAFAEIEKFIDTPVKRYSSGMYVRLAFAVAAHLEPEILIVDEVLAVGDTKFQKKCLGKMEDVGRSGRTVIFVSHNMSAINQLCKKSLLLDQGKLIVFTDTATVITKYLSENIAQKNNISFDANTPRDGSGEIRFESVRLIDQRGQLKVTYSLGETMSIAFRLGLPTKLPIGSLKVGLQIRASDGLPITNIIDVDSGFNTSKHVADEISVVLSDIRLYPETYSVSLWVGPKNSSTTYDHIDQAITFEIINDGRLTSRQLPRSAGIIFLTPTWQTTGK